MIIKLTCCDYMPFSIFMAQSHNRLNYFTAKVIRLLTKFEIILLYKKGKTRKNVTYIL